MKTLMVLATVVVLLAGCAPSEAAIQEAIEATAAAMPTATVVPTVAATATVAPTLEPTATVEATATAAPTAVPLGEVDLGPLVIVEGDLPDELDGDLVVYGESGRYDRDNLPKPDNLVSQGLYNTELDSPAGSVVVYVYEDAAVASETYSEFVLDMNGLGGYFSEYLDNVGERAKLENNGGSNLHLAFLRCHAFVEVFMGTKRDTDIVRFAQNLDGRLAPVVCPAE